MTPSDKITEVLQGVRELADRATAGMWEVTNDDGLWITYKNGAFDIAEMCLAKTEATKNDAAFIAASRDMLPRLVAALEHEMQTNDMLFALAFGEDRDMCWAKRRAELAAILGDNP